jgi:hypothetical protein
MKRLGILAGTILAAVASAQTEQWPSNLRIPQRLNFRTGIWKKSAVFIRPGFD